MSVGPVEDSGVAEAIRTAASLAADLLDDMARLAAISIAFDYRDWIAFGALGPQLFAFAVFIVIDNRVSGGENSRGRTIVLLQTYDMSVWIIALEI